MPSLRDIRRRIASVKNTQQITSAMKMVSAAKLQRAQDRVLAARPYAERLQHLITQLDARVRPTAHALLTPRTEGKTLLVVVTSDRGLCGGFNANVQRAAAELVRQLGGNAQVDVIAVGKKGRDFLTYRRIDMLASHVELFVRQVAYEQACELAAQLLEAYEQAGYKEVLILFNRFRSAMQQVVTTLRLLPMSAHPTDEAEPTEPFDYIYEPAPAEVLDSLLRRELEVQLFQIFLESFAGEHGARMTAMDSATENASDMIASLTLTFNRARQAAITKELIEVVSGADALG
ncbi:MAG: ATP synthase F1 subunit gamma [Candidatus Tectimicrobiota bacterium]